MSLITDDLLLKLWELAQTQPSDERASAKLWTHQCSKHFFPEKDWVVSHGPRRQDSSGRRGVDFTVDYMREGNSLAVLVFHEAEASDRSPQTVEGAEARAYDACVRCLEAHPDWEYVYAFTKFGTRGRAWRCGRGEHLLTALFGSQGLGEPDQYIKVHYPEVLRISQAVRMMRAALPDF
ncbi:uncharacterized protein BO66DRAFT_387512 [Aspergillus aculeatinus CBS 121060]|uniref:Uncharacterized protein n=1 Tax=Aspergillus aculeatinus CBS 121060 TaxID=1448322 RepID=A0ACD1HPW8_9EURO|nr:hypothetical protein BO66DRAFT_387512 [Aspergillus aculeatinus CBS 121060]RAH75678.1 hypothetical protein BO66DRAFT_387512 [Aspergillus aculeatinus CBS 121060]